MTRYSSVSPGTDSCTAETTSDATSKLTRAGELTNTPKPASVTKNGSDLDACSLAVPPSWFQVSTTWPFLTNGVKRSPNPYTFAPTGSVNRSTMNSPSGALIEARERTPEPVSGAPSPAKRRPQPPDTPASAVSRPEVRRTASASRSIRAATSDGVSANAGAAGRSLTKWLARTAITSG